ncbi:MAG: hypothetical protein RIQ53_685, partial [Pseudomonadota bacterium]
AVSTLRSGFSGGWCAQMTCHFSVLS